MATLHLTAAAATNEHSTATLLSNPTLQQYNTAAAVQRPPAQWAPSLKALMEEAQRSGARTPPTFVNFSHPSSPHSPRPIAPLRAPFSNEGNHLDSRSVSPIMARSPSVVSDRMSTVSGLTAINASNLSSVYPPPSYVAAISASQVVSEHRSRTRRRPSSEDDSASNKDDVHFSNPALQLVNQFLDHLLFTFLSTARSTSLLALRPAVSDALKGKLSKEAIANAEGELKELLGGGEEDELHNEHNAAEVHPRRWDLELVWKRTRLRVMVYTRLGEMEDEDEDRYVEEGELLSGSDRRFSQATGLVSWAAAIFLTSVLEYIAEQTLQIAGHAACTRVKFQNRRGDLTPVDQVVVEDFDVEKVALNAMLGRLWRTWRRNLRNTDFVPQSPGSRSTSRLSNNHDQLLTTQHMRRDSLGTARAGRVSERGHEGDWHGHSRGPSQAPIDIPDADHPEHVIAANIPLPMEESDRDVEEIETPGLARPLPFERRHVRSGSEELSPRVFDSAEVVANKRHSLMNPETIRSFGGLPTPDELEKSNEDEAPEPPTSAKATEVETPPSPMPTPVQLQLPEDKALGTLPEDIKANIREQKFNAGDLLDIKRRSIDVSSLLALERGTKDLQVGKESAGSQPDDGPIGLEEKPGGVKNIINEEREDANDSDTLPAPVQMRKPENIDKRKHLVSFKDLLVGPIEGETSRKGEPVTLPQHGTESRNASTTSVASDGSHSTDDSFTLGKKGEKSSFVHRSPAKPHHMQSEPQDGHSFEETKQTRKSSGGSIGVAKTADLTAEDLETETMVKDSQARDQPHKRNSRLIIRNPSIESMDHASAPNNTAPTEASANTKEFGPPIRSQSGQWEVIKDSTSRPAPNDQTGWNAAIATKRASAPHRVTLTEGPQRSASPTTAKNRKSWAATIDKGDERRRSLQAANTADQQKSSSTQPLVSAQLHPAAQKMAAIKNNQKPVDNDMANLTSASIRGPEDFEMFAANEETVKYTLTPDNVQEAPTDHHASTLSRLEGASAAAMALKSTSAADVRVGRDQTARTTDDAAAEDEDEELARKRREQYRRSISRPPIRNTSLHRKSGFMAREPRVQTESTRDLADFLRSTGPGKEKPEARPVITASRSSTSLHSLRPVSLLSMTSKSRARSESPSGERVKSFSRSYRDSTAVPPMPAMPGNKRSTLQARDAAGATAGNSELIDFIRNGPGQDDSYRASRSAAPSRTTMDSDQIRGLGDSFNTRNLPDLSLNVGHAADNRSSVAASSQRTSANSRTLLLSGSSMNAGAVAHPAYSGQPVKLSNTTTNASPKKAPARKQYRNKDPYAIDLDDEDEDLLTALPGGKKKNQESLMDFLNNTEPPAPKATKSTASSPSGSRRGSMQNQNGPRAGYASSVRSVQSNASARNAQSGTKSFSAATALPQMETKNPTGGKAEPRSPEGQGTGTGDMAEFLRFTGPDPEGDDGGAPAPTVSRGDTMKVLAENDLKKEKKLGFFGRRKSLKKTWLSRP